MAEEEAGVRLAKEAIQALLKARKNLRLYPSNNPIYAKTIEDAYGKLAAVFELQEELSLRIARNEIFVGGDSVFQGAGKDDNLALMLFRDGLREVVFKRELSVKEFESFVEILSLDFDREDVEEDVVTLMWQKDFEHIGYKADENILTEDEDYEKEAVAQAKESVAGDDDLKRAYEDALRADGADVVRIVPIAEKDLKTLSETLAKDAGEKKRKLIDIVFELMGHAETIEEYKDFTHILNSIVEFSLEGGDFGSPVVIFEKLREFSSVLPPGDERRRQLAVVFWFAGSPQTIKTVGALLDSDTKVDAASFERYVGFLDKSAMGSLLGLLAGLRSEGARRVVISGLVTMGRGDVALLARGLGDERWHVACDIVHVLRIIGDKKAVEYLVKAVGHADIRVKKEVLKALGDMGGHAAAHAIKEHLDHPEPSIRAVALRAMGNVGSEYARNTLLWRMSDKNFIDTDFNEKKEYFEVLSRWKDAAVEDFLLKILKKGSLFKRAKHNEMKAGAAYCLGLMGSRESLPELEKLRNTRDEILSEYAYAAIKRIEYGR